MGDVGIVSYQWMGLMARLSDMQARQQRTNELLVLIAETLICFDSGSVPYHRGDLGRKLAELMKPTL